MYKRRKGKGKKKRRGQVKLKKSEGQEDFSGRSFTIKGKERRRYQKVGFIKRGGRIKIGRKIRERGQRGRKSGSKKKKKADRPPGSPPGGKKERGVRRPSQKNTNLLNEWSEIPEGRRGSARVKKTL